ncbi:hypothetical protein ONS95_004541 [Cadophora gregata]|uniref:uncharacterized protein n=1 Tax=Cadophora gregata TaxID=51156 RepID=UPI0026DBC36C|nr:uncharacterized protein ONS95_004541 [Cadophora gregata]KAK0106035.1 hypothetical protein ONS95_004541 [Cadophora gregata]
MQDEVPSSTEPDPMFAEGDSEDLDTMLVSDGTVELVDSTGSTIELVIDAVPSEPVIGVDPEGTFVLLPGDDSDPATEESFTIIPSPGPNPTISTTRTLPGRVTSLSSGLGVVLPGSTLVPVDPFLPALTGSTTVISGQTFVEVANPTTVPLVRPSQPSATNTITATLPGRITSVSGSLIAVISTPTTVPVNTFLPDLEGSTTVVSSHTFVIISQPTTLAISVPKPSSHNHITTPLPGRTTMISGTLNVVLPGSTRVPVNENLSGLNGKTTVIGSQTFVDVANPITVPVNFTHSSSAEPTGVPSGTDSVEPFGDEPKSNGMMVSIGRWDLVVIFGGIVFMVGIW